MSPRRGRADGRSTRHRTGSTRAGQCARASPRPTTHDPWRGRATSSRSNRPSGASTVITPSAHVGDEGDGHEMAGVELEDVVGRVVDHRHARRRARRRRRRRPDCRSGRGPTARRVVDRLGRQRAAGQLLRRVAVGDALELHDPAGSRAAAASDSTTSHCCRRAAASPASTRSVRSERERRRSTAPRTPWARPMRPTSSIGASGTGRSVGEVDVDLDAVACRCRTHDGADALRRPATAADHATEVAVADADLELDAVATLERRRRARRRGRRRSSARCA